MAVPKPINLPSRKAENNGFDPNLQLVPGGSWAGGGARPSSGSPAPATGTLGQPGPPKLDAVADASVLAPTASRAPWSAAPSGSGGRGNAGQDFPRLAGQGRYLHFCNPSTEFSGSC